MKVNKQINQLLNSISIVTELNKIKLLKLLPKNLTEIKDKKGMENFFKLIAKEYVQSQVLLVEYDYFEAVALPQNGEPYAIKKEKENIYINRNGEWEKQNRESMEIAEYVYFKKIRSQVVHSNFTRKFFFKLFKKIFFNKKMISTFFLGSMSLVSFLAFVLGIYFLKYIVVSNYLYDYFNYSMIVLFFLLLMFVFTIALFIKKIIKNWKVIECEANINSEGIQTQSFMVSFQMFILSIPLLIFCINMFYLNSVGLIQIIVFGSILVIEGYFTGEFFNKKVSQDNYQKEVPQFYYKLIMASTLIFSIVLIQNRLFLISVIGNNEQVLSISVQSLIMIPFLLLSYAIVQYKYFSIDPTILKAINMDEDKKLKNLSNELKIASIFENDDSNIDKIYFMYYQNEQYKMNMINEIGEFVANKIQSDSELLKFPEILQLISLKQLDYSKTPKQNMNLGKKFMNHTIEDSLVRVGISKNRIKLLLDTNRSIGELMLGNQEKIGILLTRNMLFEPMITIVDCESEIETKKLRNLNGIKIIFKRNYE